MSVHVRSTGIGRFGRRSEPIESLLAEAGSAALEPLGRKPIDLLVVGSMLPELLGGASNLCGRVADLLGLDLAQAVRVEAASATGAAAVHAGWAAIASGRARRALVVAGERMTARPTVEVATALARSLAPEECSVGATMPGLAALVTQRYLARYGQPESTLDLVSVAARAAGTRNPSAQFRESVRPEEVRSSRPIALPLRLLHCSAISDGAAAVVLEEGEGEATLLGLGQSTDHLALTDRSDLTSFRATRVAAERAFEMARVAPRSVEVAEVHDAFAPFAFVDLEDLGLVGPGEGPTLYGSGETAGSRRLSVNPSGGLLARGHPVGASGLVQVAEVARQLLGTAEAMQIDGPPKIGVAQSIGGLASHNFVTVLGRPGVP